MASLLEVAMWFGSSQRNIKKLLGENSGKAFSKEEWSVNADFSVPPSFYFPGKIDDMAGVVATILDYNINFIQGTRERTEMGKYIRCIL